MLFAILSFRFAIGNEVTVVDASGPIVHPELSEVSTMSHKVFSPAKVICHSPSPEKSPRRGGIIDQNIRVTVPPPKEVVFTSENVAKIGNYVSTCCNPVSIILLMVIFG